MVMFLLFCLASVGLTAILVDGKIFQPLRNGLHAFHAVSEEKRSQGKFPFFRLPIDMIHGVMTCHQCCGFWCGLVCSCIILYDKNFEMVVRDLELLVVLCGGFAGSILSLLYLRIDEFLFAKTMFYKSRTSPPQDEE